MYRCYVIDNMTRTRIFSFFSVSCKNVLEQIGWDKNVIANYWKAVKLQVSLKELNEKATYCCMYWYLEIII